MKRILCVLSLVVLLPSCGGGGGSPTAPTVTMPPGPSSANITVVQNGTAQLCLSPIKKIRIAIPVTIAESAGLGFAVNFANMTLYKNGEIKVESNEIGASDITAGLGSNHFGARSSTNVRVHFDFNHSGNSFDYARETFNFTDERGNRHEVALPGVSPLVVVLFCTI